MIPRKILRLFFLGLWAGFAGIAMVQAQTPQQDFQNQANADCNTITTYVNGQFAKSMGFYTTLGWASTPRTFNFLNGPHFEVGAGLGADVMAFPDLNNLVMGALNLGSNISLPSVVPAPFPVGTLRVGLFNDMDCGLKINYLPLVSLPDLGFSANYIGWGVDFRYKIMGGKLLPTVLAGVSFDDMSGSFTITTNVNQTTTYQDGIITYPNTTLTGTSVYTLNWATKSFGARVEVGKDLGTIFPFASVGFQRNIGSISSVINVNGSASSPGPPSWSGNISASGFSSNQPVIFEPKFVAGFDVGQGFHWVVVGESNGVDVAGSSSFLVEF